MVSDNVLRSAYMGEFKPYSIKFDRLYKGGFILWGTYTIEIYKLYYDETPIAEGGLKSMTDKMNLANAAFNLGIAETHLLSTIDFE